MKQKNKIQKRDIAEVTKTFFNTVYGQTDAVDYWEEPYTMVYLASAEGTTHEHLLIMRVILMHLNKKTFKISVKSDKIKENLTYLLTIKLIIETGIDHDNDIDFKNKYCYNFIECVENNGDTYMMSVTKGFYKNMDKYFTFSDS